MLNSSKHLILFDSACGLCQRSIRFIIQADKKKQFVFAPLDGITAGKFSEKLSIKNLGESVVLIEDYQSIEPKAYFLSKAILRTLWLLGGAYSILGCLNFFPTFLSDKCYQFISKKRKRSMKCDSLFASKHFVKERLLP